MLQKDIQVYLSYLESVKQYSQHTLNGYKRDLQKLSKYLSDQEIDKWKLVKEHDLRTFVNSERRRGLSPRSIQRILSSYRTFFEFLLLSLISLLKLTSSRCFFHLFFCNILGWIILICLFISSSTSLLSRYKP